MNTDAVLLQAFECIAVKGWKAFSLEDISQGQTLFLKPIDVPLCLFEHANVYMASIVTSMTLSESPRENLCELVLLRLEYLAPYKKGLAAIHRDMLCTPSLVAALLPVLQDHLGWLLKTAGYTYDPLTFFFARQALGILLFQTQQTWLDDDTADLSPTLSFLDRKLTLYEEMMVQA